MPQFYRRRRYSGRKRKSPKFRKATRWYVKKQLGKNTETKRVDHVITRAAAATSTITCLTELTQDTTDINGRIGDEIMLKSIKLKYFASNGGATVDAGTFFRITILQWHPYNFMYPPALTDIYENATTNVNVIWSHFKFDLRQQFTILYDKVYYTQHHSDVEDRVTFNKWIDVKFAKKKIRFLGNTIKGTNHIYFLQTVTNATNFTQGFIRLTYKDA